MWQIQHSYQSARAPVRIIIQMPGIRYIFKSFTELVLPFFIQKQLNFGHGQKLTCSDVTVERSLSFPSSSFKLYPSGLLSLSVIFHNLIVLSLKEKTSNCQHRNSECSYSPFTMYSLKKFLHKSCAEIV